jgi:hypothetical protein
VHTLVDDHHTADAKLASNPVEDESPPRGENGKVCTNTNSQLEMECDFFNDIQNDPGSPSEVRNPAETLIEAKPEEATLEEGRIENFEEASPGKDSVDFFDN